MAWEYGDDELVALCEDCHDGEHRGPSIFAAVPSTLRADLSAAVRRGDVDKVHALTAQAAEIVRR